MLRMATIILMLCCAASVVSPQSGGRSGAWLNGTWEGTGYQIDTDSTWTMRLTVRGKRYLIEYPSLTCGGRWRPLSINSRRSRFREHITSGLERCADRGTVVIEKLSRGQIAFRYSHRGASEVSSSAILNRKK